jgi:hypothetical protein
MVISKVLLAGLEKPLFAATTRERINPQMKVESTYHSLTNLGRPPLAQEHSVAFPFSLLIHSASAVLNAEISVGSVNPVDKRHHSSPTCNL